MNSIKMKNIHFTDFIESSRKGKLREIVSKRNKQIFLAKNISYVLELEGLDKIQIHSGIESDITMTT